MLQSVRIYNFRSCREVLLENLEDVTVLVGRNSAGKTNILKAIRWVVSFAAGRVEPPASFWFPEEGDPLADLTFNVGEQVYRYSATVAWASPRRRTGGPIKEKLERQSNDTWNVLVSRDSDEATVDGIDKPIPIGSLTPALPALVALIPNRPLAGEIREILNYLGSVRYYPLDEPNDPEDPEAGSYIPYQSYAEWLTKAQTRPDLTDSALMRLIHLWQDDSDGFEELKSLMGNDGLGLLDDILVRSFDTTQGSEKEKPKAHEKEKDKANLLYVAHFIKADPEPRVLRYGDLSHGTRRVLRILVSLIHDKSAVLLIEHPEDGIHPGLLNKLIGIVHAYASPTQFIITSHSTELFNQVKPKQIRMVTMENGVTAVRSLTTKELGVAQKHLVGQGTLAEFLDGLEDK